MRAGLEAVRFGAVKYILPFFFVYNPVLVAQSGSLLDVTVASIAATLGVFLLAYALQGWVLGVGPLGATPAGTVFLGGRDITCMDLQRLRSRVGVVTQRTEILIGSLADNIALFDPSITEELGVQAVPTLLVFREGEELARYEGPYSREALNDRLTQLLAGKRNP